MWEKESRVKINFQYFSETHSSNSNTTSQNNEVIKLSPRTFNTSWTMSVSAIYVLRSEATKDLIKLRKMFHHSITVYTLSTSFNTKFYNLKSITGSTYYNINQCNSYMRDMLITPDRTTWWRWGLSNMTVRLLSRYVSKMAMSLAMRNPSDSISTNFQHYEIIV